MKTKKKSNYAAKAAVNNHDNKEPIPNGFFKKRIFSFGLCFSWIITVFCLLFGDAQNSIHSQLAIYSFLTGVAFTFALVFKSKINTSFFTFIESMKHDEHNKNN
jgi:hypothetical protein